MDVKLQLILGVFLILDTCSCHVNNTISQNPSSDTIDSDINLIEKLPKTEADLKITNKNYQFSNHSSNLEKFHPNSKFADQNQTDDKDSLSITNNEVEKENKDNTIRQDPIEKSRKNDSRSIDIQKLIPSEFQNNVYTHPIPFDTEKYIDDPHHKTTTRIYSDFAKFELSTPKTEFFDKKFEEAKQKLEQDFESNGYDHDYDHHEDPDDLEYYGLDNVGQKNDNGFHLGKLFDDTNTNPNVTIDYKEEIDISKNNTIEKNSKHDDFTLEQRKKINFMSSYGESSTYRYKIKDTDPDTTSKIFSHTTGKSTTLTKPPTNNNSHILSNKIETETVKAIPSVTNRAFTKSVRDGNELIPREQTVEENKVELLNITFPKVMSEVISTTANLLTTERNDVVTQTALNEGTETNPSSQNNEPTTSKDGSTVAATDSTTMSHESVTSSEETSSAESTLIIQESTTNTGESTTTEGETTTIVPNFTTNIENVSVNDEKTTTSEPVTTEGITNDKLIPQTTETQSTTSEDTVSTTTDDTEGTSVSQFSDTDVTTTILFTEETTFTVVEEGTTDNLPETTESSARVSKGVVFPESATTVLLDTTTNVMITMDINGSSTDSPTTINTSVETFTTDTFTVITPNITHTNETTVAVPMNFTSTTAETITTSFQFVHVETRDNHTTLLPETLSPDWAYPTTAYEKSRSANVSNDYEPTTIVTTPEEEVTETAASTEHATIDNTEENNGKIAAIVISTVGAVCLILLAGLLYVMRKRQKRFNYKQRCRPVNLDDYSVDNVSVYNSVRRKADRQSKRSYGNPAFEDPVAVTHPLNFPALAKFASNAEDIKAEFEEIPQITARTSELPEGCEPKNRYANVIPLPETRVFLKTIEGYPNSDYINANYVTGPKNAKGYYIACQAPMQNTVDDFWRMVWEQQSKVILMITHFFENGVEKCFDYLPPSEVLDCNRLFGDFQVTLKNRDAKDKYIISSLQLKNMVSNSWREVTHFWYLGWPEKGVPSEGNSLIAFLIEARSFMKSSTLDKITASNGNMNGSAMNEVNPVVVHCSPGTGRTGVVIACDIAIRDFEQTRLVDIPKIVYKIRRDRASAVQTKEQYMLIYKIVSLYATKLSGGTFESF
ncbi:hypothetical protein JTB14_024657 [Gonioctena quinquepunctata]|nr:hypothetical protein JTB14_024657 [Gonioctena quinquepunctata]